MERLIFVGALSYFFIKLPLTDLYYELAFVVTAILFAGFNIWKEENHFWGNVIGIVLNIGICGLSSDYSIFETTAFAIMCVSYVIKMLKPSIKANRKAPNH